MPPLVNAPSASGKPTKSATQRSACSSTQVGAARATWRGSRRRWRRAPRRARRSPARSSRCRRGTAGARGRRSRRARARRRRARPRRRRRPRAARARSRAASARVELGLGAARAVERRPRVGDHAAEVGEHALAVGQRGQRRPARAAAAASAGVSHAAPAPSAGAPRRCARPSARRRARRRAPSTAASDRAVLGDVGLAPVGARRAGGEQAAADLDDPQRLEHDDELAVAGRGGEREVEVAARVVGGDPRRRRLLARDRLLQRGSGRRACGAPRRAARSRARRSERTSSRRSTSSRPGLAARKPRFGRNSASPSPVRRRSASRTGVREMPSCSASSTWPSRAPGGISPSITIERMRS